MRNFFRLYQSTLSCPRLVLGDLLLLLDIWDKVQQYVLGGISY